MPTELVGIRLKRSLVLTPQPLSAFRRAAPAPTSPCKRRGRGKGEGGAALAIYRGLGSPYTAHRPRKHFVASKGNGGEKQAGESEPYGRCSPSCPSTSAPAGRWGGRNRPLRSLPSRRACGERCRAAPPPPSPAAPQEGPGSPWGPSRRAARAGPRTSLPRRAPGVSN